MDQHSSDRQASQASGARGRDRNANRRWRGLQDLLAKAGLGGFEDPSVTTDQADYGPGETAVITAKGFKRGDRINFAIADDPQDPGDDGDADVYAPFSVRDGSPEDGDGTINGQVVAKWIVPRDNNGSGAGSPDALNATLHLKAKGAHGAAATTSFTDSTVDAAAGTTELADPPLDPPVPAVSLDQSDYEPGETATITASGFALGSAVAFAIADDPDQPGDDGEADVYVPFAISDGSADDLDGLVNGEVVTTWMVPADGNAALNITAMGAEGESASASATISAASVAAATNPLAPTVSTDQSDYAPNETATITARGFTPGSRVEFGVEIVSDPGGDGVFGTSDDVVDLAATQLLAETPWLVEDGTSADLDPAEGSVQTTWLVDPDALNRTLRLTARGFGPDGVKATLDDELAMTSFTDAQGSFSKPYAHWSDEPLPGDWNNNILNDNKSNYFEGEVIPHVFMYGASNNSQLVNGQSYSFNVTYNWYQQNTDAGGFAYMTQYDLSRQPNVFDWATPAITPTADDDFTNAGGMVVGSNFYTVDADITNVSAVSYTGTGTKDGHVTLTFTYTGTTTRNGYAAIYYGLYVAKPGEVPDQGLGKTNGANAWSGGSLQTTVDIGGSGATSLQLAPSAIIPGEISGLKFNDLDASGTQNTGEAGLKDWTIILDSDSDFTNGYLDTVLTADGDTDDLDGDGVTDPLGFYYFSVTPGTYYVYEVNQDQWVQTAPSPVKYYGPLVISATTPKYLNKDFGNHLAETTVGLEGHKWHDLNADGTWQQPAEPGLPGWTIYLDLNNDNSYNDTVEPFAVTGDGGGWSITADLQDGTYYLREELLTSGWIQSNPTSAVSGEYRIEVLNGLYKIFNDTIQVANGEIDFGNYQYVLKTGMKFHDLDADGIKDAGEGGLSGWTIQALQDGVVVDSTTTGSDGSYSFSLKPGTYTFQEVLQDDWYQSYPTGGTYTEELVSGIPSTGNDFGNYQYVLKTGMKFHDLDADGIKDAGEGGLSGWTIQALQDGVVVDSTTTGSDGSYSFSLKPGTYTFQEVLQDDWYQSYPTGGTYTEELVSGIPSTGNDFGNYQYVLKTGMKFHDLDADGIKDAGEGGLSGWTIQALQDGVVVDSTTTGSDGSYSFSLKPGTYTFQEVLQDDWYQSYPTGGTYTEELVSGIPSTGNDFGNYQYVLKTGMKFHDLDADGIKDAGEGGLSGWTIQALQDGVVVDSTTTGSDGSYSFSLKPGTYTFQEVLQDDWYQSYPTGGTYTEELVSGIPSTGNDFGNYQYVLKTGMKFHDLDADGIKDAGEGGLSGWTIQALQDGVVVDSTTTGSDGSYSFSLKPGTYTFQEVLQDDWYQSYPTGGTYTEELVSGIPSTGNDFGNYQYVLKTGMKFHDLDADGIKDAGEGGLSGWTIQALQDGVVVDSTTTGSDGSYSFSLKPGTYTFQEVLQDDWYQSYPTGGTYTEELVSGIPSTGNDFGNYQYVLKTGMKFHDLDADGIKDAGEGGLSGWTIQALQDGVVVDSTTTGSDGSYSFSLKPGTYTFQEVLQDDWYQSYPTGGTYTEELVSGIPSTGNDFGNYQYVLKTGMKFHDLDADGIKDAGEGGLSGWTIQALQDGVVVDSTTTGSDGSYSFSLKPGTYTFQEVLQDDWYQSYPTGGTYTEELVSGIPSTGNDFGNYQYVLKTGMKFHDLDADGIKDAGEGGLSGWTIQALQDGVVVDSTTTGSDGSYSFSLKPGTYTFQEVLQDDWYQSYPTGGTYTEELVSGIPSTGNDFGNYQYVLKTGMKFHDLDADGIKDAGEGGLSGWTIQALQDGVVVDSTTTGSDGSYSFSLKPGTYTFQEVLQDDWYQSYPTGGTYTEELVSGIPSTGNDFGNYQYVLKTGMKFHDLDADGIKDAGEGGLSGWTIQALQDGVVVDSTTTGSDGSYSFSLKPGTYTFQEVLQDDWYQSYPTGGTYTEELVSGIPSTGNDFGNYQYALKTGTKFNDLNANGARDAGEPGLAGWTITLVGTGGDGSLVNLSTTTDANGSYSFVNLMPGAYTVSEVLQDGWKQTAPDILADADDNDNGALDGDWDIVLTSGEIEASNDFGNIRVGACGLTPGFWLGGAANPKINGVAVSIWDGDATNVPDRKLATLRGTISDAVIDQYKDVLLTPEFMNNNVVKKAVSGYVSEGGNYVNPITADFALGLKAGLRNFGGDGRLDQIYIENSDARKILGTGYQPGDRFGALLRKDLAMILNIAGQQNYAQVTQLRSAIYDWVGYNAFKAGILTELGDVNGDGADDWVINYQAATSKKSAGFGADGKFLVASSSAAWTTGGDVLPTPPSTPATTYAGQTLFNVLSAQFEGSCNLDVSLDGSHVLTEGANGLTNGIYANNGNLNLFASTLPSYAA